MQNGSIESFNGRMRDELKTLFSISTTHAPRSLTGSLTTIFGGLTRRKIPRRGIPPTYSPQRTIGYAIPTSSVDPPLLHPRHLAYKTPRL